jgi:hypothetical protein
VCVYACANGVLLSLTLQAAAKAAVKASHAPGNVKGTNRPRMTTTERGTCVCMLVQMVCFCPLPCKLQPKLHMRLAMLRAPIALACQPPSAVRVCVCLCKWCAFVPYLASCSQSCRTMRCRVYARNRRIPDTRLCLLRYANIGLHAVTAGSALAVRHVGG